MDEILVEEYRGEVLENIHRGYVCGVSDDGEVKYFVGDTEHMTYMRSSAKPIQAIPVIKRGLDSKYNFTDQEAAIISASHRGEEFHIKAIESIMKKIGVTEEEFVCLPTYPLCKEARETLIAKNMGKRRVYHNCSGKHLGIMTLAKGMGLSTENYWEINHPAQGEILKHISILSGYPTEDIRVGVDGCGVPVFAMPIKNLATAYLNLACPDLIPDNDIREAVQRITWLMNEYNEMISGTNTICSTLLKDKNIVAKGGAKGVYCFGLKRERLGFALKVMDGSEEEWPIIIAAILEQINYSNQDTIADLYKLGSRQIRNDNDRVVGVNEVVFTLKSK